MRFQVPQFIEVEDKIFGPLTLKQFLYVAGGGAVIFLLKQALPFFLFVVAVPLVGAAAAALAFLKVNNQPFVLFLSHALNYYIGKKLFVWRKSPRKEIVARIPAKASPLLPLSGGPKLTEKRLEDLAWSLDFKEKIKR